jgi:cob(I)alamin adenosyltransferase
LEGGDTLIQVYTGRGKGKTTAALGLALRAAGAGKRIYFAQFLKGRQCSELKILKKIKNIKLEQFGRDCLVKRKPQAKDIALARAGWAKVKKIIRKNFYDLIILDEINIVLKLKILDLKSVLALIKAAGKKVEIVLTGRSAPREILKIADLVSQIQELKHYYKKGVVARKGIEF